MYLMLKSKCHYFVINVEYYFLHQAAELFRQNLLSVEYKDCPTCKWLWLRSITKRIYRIYIYFSNYFKNVNAATQSASTPAFIVG